MANYLVATLSDRIQAEAAYITLEEADLPVSQLSIFGQGFKSADECLHFDPTVVTWQKVKLMMWWLIPFGFFGGFTFNQITGLTIWSAFSTVGNGILGGLFGAVAGGLGALAMNNGAKLFIGKDSIPFSQRLAAGQYLVVVQGSENLIRKAVRAFKFLESENFQIYELPD